MQFTIQGHKNILATHKTTIEFTKDNYLTKQGDCIVGINANFNNKPLKGKIMITIKIDGIKDTITATANPNFNSHEMVIRTSDFLDKRTFAINADKAAIDIKRNLVEKLKNSENTAAIEISTIQ